MSIFDKLKRSKKTKESADKKSEEVKKPAKEKKTQEPKAREQKAQEQVKTQEKQVEKKTSKKTKYRDAYKVLIKPVVSEKATMLTSQGSYVFVVAPKMNKIEVKKAVKSVYGVEPVKVNIINVAGRNVRYGKTTGRTKSWKKAIVTLKPGDSIQLYEGV